MRKIVLLAFSVIIMLTGCSSDKTSSQESITETVTEISTMTETVTEKSTEKAIETKHTEATQKETKSEEILNNKNVREYELSLPENAGYLKFKKGSGFDYNYEYVLPDGQKLIGNKNLYLEDLSGDRIPIIEVPEEETEKYVVFWDMIDDNRFCYYIAYHENTAGTGVYDLETGEDFRIDVCEDHSGYVPTKIIDNYLWFERIFIADFRGIGKLNLDTYEFTEIDCSELSNTNFHFWIGMDISPDGTKAAVYNRKVSRTDDINEYKVTVYSLTEEKILNTYNFYSKNDYINHQLLYYSEDQIYLYLYQYDDPQNYLYIIDVE